jgi:hypothetical protein
LRPRQFAALSAALLAALVTSAGTAQAHGFEERYDLPVPLAYVVTGACVMVGLSFLAAILFARDPAAGSPTRRAAGIALPRPLLLATRGIAWLLFVLAVASALWGTGDPLMNLAPTLVWIVWWVGLSFVSALICDIWPAIDPWRTTFDVLDAAARRLGQTGGMAIGLRWPAWLGLWPAVLLLLAWCWLEIVYPLASSPFKVGCAALLWTAVNLGGMVAFGRTAWQAHADVFAVVFSTLGRMAPLRLAIDDTAIDDAAPVRATRGQVAFVMAMLATVIFDGLHGGAAWFAFEGLVRRLAPQWMDVNNYFVGTVGLATVWLGFLVAYVATLHVSLALMGAPRDGTGHCAHQHRATLAARLAITLVPIAAAYNVAHNFSSLVIQGQNVFALVSDPFGRQWDLFGTAHWYPDISIVDARLTWFVAVIAIVLGHAASIWWSHRVALAAGVPPRRGAVAMLPLTLLMIGYTAVSLTLIAEPMVATPG